MPDLETVSKTESNDSKRWMSQEWSRYGGILFTIYRDGEQYACGSIQLNSKEEAEDWKAAIEFVNKRQAERVK